MTYLCLSKHYHAWTQRQIATIAKTATKLPALNTCPSKNELRMDGLIPSLYYALFPSKLLHFLKTSSELLNNIGFNHTRSEERRVGKEC